MNIPATVALEVIGGATLGHGPWERRSNAMARGLRAGGIGPGDAVALVFDNARWTDFACAYRAVGKVGAMAVPLGPRLCPMELPRILDHCRARATICPADLAPRRRQGWLVEPVSLEDGQDSDPFEPPSQGCETRQVLYASAPLRLPSAIEPAASPPFDLGELPAGTLLHAFPLGSPAGQWALSAPLEHPGITSAVAASFEPDRFCATVEDREVDVVGFAPPLARAMVECLGSRKHDLSCVRRLLLTSPPSPALATRLAEVFPNAVVVELAGAKAAPSRRAEPPQPQRQAPLTSIQASMVWQEQFTPGRFNLQPLVRRLVGHLDVGVLERALGEIARRHEALRATVRVVDGRPVQVVTPASSVDSDVLDVVDLTSMSPVEREAEVAGVIDGATNRRFDLVTGPLYRPQLVRLGPEEHVLVVASHHSSWDAWSVGVFHRELTALYGSLLEGSSASLAQPAAQVGDACRREADLFASDAGEAERTWWQERLGGAPLVLQLPIDDPDLAVGSPHPSSDPFSLDLPPGLTSRLRALARAQRTTPFTVLLAALQVLVHRCTGQDDLLITSAAARRERVELHGVIGCLFNRLLVRLRLGGDPTFAEVVARAGDALLGTLSHPNVADEVVLNEALGGGDAAAHGLAPRLMLLFQGAQLPKPIEMAGVTVAPIRGTSMGAKRVHMTTSGHRRSDDDRMWGMGLYEGTFLALTALEGDAGVSIVARGTFHRPAVERLLAQYRRMLERVVEDPARRVSQLALLADEDRAEMEGWNDTAFPAPAGAGLHELVRDQAGRTPDAVALVGEHGRLTYSELDARSDRLAADLGARGVAPGALVALCLAAPVELVVAVMAVWKAGGAYVALDLDLGHSDDLGQALAKAGVEVAVVDHASRRLLSGDPVRLVVLEPGGTVEGADVTEAGPRDRSEGESEGSRLACAFYADGASGAGVKVTHASVLNLVAGLRRDVLETARGLPACLSPLLVDPGFLRQLALLADGRTLHVVDHTTEFGRRELVSAVGESRVDVVDCTAEQFVSLLDAGLQAAVLARARTAPTPVLVVSTDRAIDAPTWAAIRAVEGANVLRLYGPAQAGFGATVATVGQAGARDTIGRPMANVRCHVLDRWGQQAPVQVAGDLHVEGDGWLFRTGQRARYRPDGQIEVLGELSGLVDIGGFLVQPARIEAALARCPGVKEVAVVAEGELSTTPGRRRLVAYVVPDHGGPPDLAQLRAFLWAELPGYAWPAAMVVVSELPPAAGAEPDLAGASQTPEEAMLGAAWAEALGVESAPTDRSYRQCFGFAEAVSELYQAGAPVTVDQLMENRTVAALGTAMASCRLEEAGSGAEGGLNTAPLGYGASPSPSLPPTPAPQPLDSDPWRDGHEGGDVTGPTQTLSSSSGAPEVEDAPQSRDIIEIQGLTKIYKGGTAAVDGLDLTVRQGEIFGLLGPNGAGKTTTVGMLTTRVVPTAGRALIGGIDVVAEPARAKQLMGVVHETNTLDRKVTAWENLYFHGRYFGLRPKAARAAADELLERFRLGDKAKAEIQALSRGMAQRLMVARSVLHRPAVLFLDEPTGGLDPQSRLALWEILRELHHDGQTILMTTHYMEEADELCDRVAIMDHGRILALDTPELLKRRHGARPIVSVRAEGGDLDVLASRLREIPRTAAVERAGPAVRVHADQPTEVLPEIIACASRHGFQLSELTVSQPSLETVFIELTGKDLRE